MNPEEYYKKYTGDIRGGVEITARELFDQLKADFEITAQDREDMTLTEGNMKDIERSAKAIVANRLGSESVSTRIPCEYMHRTLILAKFPRAYRAWLQKRTAFAQMKMLQDPAYKAFNAKTLDQFTEVKRKKNSEFQKVFGDLAEEVES